MKLKIKLDNTYLDELGFNISPTYSIGSPQSKTYKVDVPFSNGSIDLTEAITGGVNYSDRTITFELQKLRPKDTWQTAYHFLLNEFQGRKVKLQMPYDDEHYFVGRVEFSALDRGDYMSVKCTFTAEPYRLRNLKTVITYEPPITETSYSLPNESMPTNPTITTTHETEIKQGTKTWVVGAGTHKLAMMFRRGMNEIRLRSMVDYNLIPVANRQFEGWNAQGGATVTVTKCPMEVFEDGYTRNLFAEANRKNWGLGNDTILSDSNLLSVVAKVEPNTIYSLRRENSANNRFRYFFANTYPTVGMLAPFDSIYNHDSDLSVTTIQSPADAQYIVIYLSNTGANFVNRFKLEKGTITTYWTKAWEDYTDAEKPAAYIETSGGTDMNKLQVVPLAMPSAEQHILTTTIKNIGSKTVRWRNQANNKFVDVFTNQLRTVSNVVDLPTSEAQIRTSFGATINSDNLKFYANNPQVYATSKRNRVTIEYQEGAL